MMRHEKNSRWKSRLCYHKIFFLKNYITWWHNLYFWVLLYHQIFCRNTLCPVLSLILGFVLSFEHLERKNKPCGWERDRGIPVKSGEDTKFLDGSSIPQNNFPTCSLNISLPRNWAKTWPSLLPSRKRDFLLLFRVFFSSSPESIEALYLGYVQISPWTHIPHSQVPSRDLRVDLQYKRDAFQGNTKPRSPKKNKKKH